MLTGRRVTITDSTYGSSVKKLIDIPSIELYSLSKGPVIVEDNVWIGDKVSILSNVHIGHECIIGANAVVTKDMPVNCVVKGILQE
jgi:acetyltransferase-like isoleucine patch superfamily enzyme